MKFKSILIFCLSFLSLQSFAQSDFNYQFYATTYTKVESFHVRDSVTNQISVKSDTASKPATVLIDKVNNKLSVRSLNDVSRTMYEANVLFSGIDQQGNLVYIAQSEQNETVVLNPIKSIVQIIFQKCIDEQVQDQPKEKDGSIAVKKYCDSTIHTFGNVLASPPPKK